jgi:hypothetical protein
MLPQLKLPSLTACLDPARGNRDGLRGDFGQDNSQTHGFASFVFPLLAILPHFYRLSNSHVLVTFTALAQIPGIVITMMQAQAALFPQAAVPPENLPGRYQTWQASYSVIHLARVDEGKQRNRVPAH